MRISSLACSGAAPSVPRITTLRKLPSAAISLMEAMSRACAALLGGNGNHGTSARVVDFANGCSASNKEAATAAPSALMTSRSFSDVDCSDWYTVRSSTTRYAPTSGLLSVNGHCCA